MPTHPSSGAIDRLRARFVWHVLFVGGGALYSCLVVAWPDPVAKAVRLSAIFGWMLMIVGLFLKPGHMARIEANATKRLTRTQGVTLLLVSFGMPWVWPWLRSLLGEQSFNLLLAVLSTAWLFFELGKTWAKHIRPQFPADSSS